MSMGSGSRRERDLLALSGSYTLWIDDDDLFVIVSGVRLPPGFNEVEAEVLIELSPSYPIIPPGIGASQVYLDPELRFRHRRLKDLHESVTPNFATPGFRQWAWLCYEYVQWAPERDDLLKFMEMIRADLTNPQTKGRFF